MFGLGIHYLMGWAMAAADGAKKELAEWPPHPDRVFMALAAAWFETGQDKSEGEALQWLEQLEPPSFVASGKEDRTVVTSFVPVNDTSVAGTTKVKSVCVLPKITIAACKDAGLSVLPEFRSRQPRTFPVAIPHDPVVHLTWSASLPKMVRSPLISLCRKVTSIGHPASLVQMWLTDTPPAANLVPITGVARYRLRVFGPGRLKYLEERCNRVSVIEFLDRELQIKKTKGKGKRVLQEEQERKFPNGVPVSLRPEPSLWQGYDVVPGTGAVPLRGSLFDPRLLVLAISGKRLPLSATLKVTEALRGALLSACPAPIPEWLSGHALDGGPTQKPHISILPLPFAGNSYADGRLMGIALALPRDLDNSEVDRVLTPWLWNEYGQARKIKLFDGRWLECTVEMELRESPPVTLRSETWTEASRQWATVTPLVLDRHFDGADKWERAAETVKESCERVDLPRPSEVFLHPVSMINGVPRSNEFPWMVRRKDGGRMHHAHAVVVFREKVRGPVILGAGRFRGYGFFRPMRQGGDWDA